MAGRRGGPCSACAAPGRSTRANIQRCFGAWLAASLALASCAVLCCAAPGSTWVQARRAGVGWFACLVNGEGALAAPALGHRRPLLLARQPGLDLPAGLRVQDGRRWGSGPARPCFVLGTTFGTLLLQALPTISSLHCYCIATIGLSAACIAHWPCLPCGPASSSRKIWDTHKAPHLDRLLPAAQQQVLAHQRLHLRASEVEILCEHDPC